MSALVTWASSGNGAKTGTTLATYITDLVALVNSYSANAAFFWQIASSSTAGNPNYIVLKRKSGSAGRILIPVYTGAPAGINPTLFEVTPALNQIHIAYFPAGNVDTPSNLTAASGTVLGNDTGAVISATGPTIAAAYAALLQVFYFDHAEGMIFAFGNPAAATGPIGLHGAGFHLVDGSDNEYAATFSTLALALADFGSTTAYMTWAASGPSAGANTGAPVIRTNYGSAGRRYFVSRKPNGTWADAVVGPTDILTDTALNKAWFPRVPLLGQVKGEGEVLKLRQIAMGPGTVGPFTPYQQTGPVVKAIQVNNATVGGTGFPWVTNFKV